MAKKKGLWRSAAIAIYGFKDNTNNKGYISLQHELRVSVERAS